jgi:hypothetical protein
MPEPGGRKNIIRTSRRFDEKRRWGMEEHGKERGRIWSSKRPWASHH